MSESDILSQGEVDSPLPQDEPPKNNALSSIGRQSSIYSLTLDEFQHTLCDGGKNFGSMNMDEFLNSIWTAEENQTINSNGNQNSIPNSSKKDVNLSLGETSSHKPLSKQPSLPRQGSLTLPLPLCRKTVEEVWSEIHKTQQHGKQKASSSTPHNATSASKQNTFGEMTLEDFLVKAGVVREQIPAPVAAIPPRQVYGVYQNNNHPPMGGPSFVSIAPMMGMVPGSVVASVGMPYPTMPHAGGGVMEPPAYGKRNGHAPPACYSGMMGSGGGYGQPLTMGVDTSPVSPDGIGTSQGDDQYGMDIGGSRGRKRIADVPVEKVVERRQRRMIKNRESAARSRARKQAYTVELEAEMNQLRDENAQLKEALAELERKQKQQYFQEMKLRAQMRAQKAKEKLRVMRRTLSCPL